MDNIAIFDDHDKLVVYINEWYPYTTSTDIRIITIAGSSMIMRFVDKVNKNEYGRYVVNIFTRTKAILQLDILKWSRIIPVSNGVVAVSFYDSGNRWSALYNVETQQVIVKYPIGIFSGWRTWRGGQILQYPDKVVTLTLDRGLVERKFDNVRLIGFKTVLTADRSMYIVWTSCGQRLWDFTTTDKPTVVCSSFVIVKTDFGYQVIRPNGRKCRLLNVTLLLEMTDDYSLAVYSKKIVKIDSIGHTIYPGKLITKIDSEFATDYIIIDNSGNIEIRDYITFELVDLKSNITCDSRWSVFRIPHSPEFVDHLSRIIRDHTQIPLPVAKLIGEYV